MFIIPYRWKLRTVWINLSSMTYDLRCGVRNLRRGVRNLWRWAPIIWRDEDYDWSYLAALMEKKLRQMAKDTERWNGATADLDGRRMLVCAEILRRLRDGDWYWENAKMRFREERLAAELARDHAEDDKRYLGELIGKYLDYWWD